MAKALENLQPSLNLWIRNNQHVPNSNQERILQQLIAERLVDEAKYAYASTNNPAKIPNSPEGQARSARLIGAKLLAVVTKKLNT